MKHGGDLGRAIEIFGGEYDDWIDLSTGINPFSYQFGDEPARSKRDTRLPESARLNALLESARSAYRVPHQTAICAAPGTEMLIRLIPFLLTGDTIQLATTYGSYREAWRLAGRALQMEKSTSFQSHPTQNIVAVSPNNPDGRIVPRERLLEWAETRTGDAVLIVDEAFADTAPDCSIVRSLTEHNPAIVLRSFGKFFGLPGIRLGFAVGRKRLIAKVAAILGDWPISTYALDIGTCALEDEAWQVDMREKLRAAVAQLDGVLVDSGLEVAGGTDLFRLVKYSNAEHLHAHLARAQILVRKFSDAPGLLRLGLPADQAQLNRLRDALAARPG